jgi:hypothetical protein
VRHCLEQALDLSKNVSEQAKRDLGNSLSKSNTVPFWDLSGHINDLTSKDTPDGFSELDYEPVWATACRDLKCSAPLKPDAKL